MKINTIENTAVGSTSGRITGRFPALTVVFKALRYVQLSALLCGATFITQAGAARALPFHGSLGTVETSVVQPPNLAVEGDGVGRATHLGRFEMTYEVTVDLATRASVGSALFIAANGDTILTEFTGQGTPIKGSNSSSIVEVHTIVGGTGRFVGAAGVFTVERVLDRTTGMSEGSFDGDIIIAR